jgi:hypothetical protein
MYNYISSPAVSNCTLSDNTAYLGGGMYNDISTPMVTNCVFSGNTATRDGVGDGGGMHTHSGSPIVSDSYFCLNAPDSVNEAYTDNGGNNFQYCAPPRPIRPEYEGDVDGDGDVDFKDVAILCGNWLAGTEPE